VELGVDAIRCEVALQGVDRSKFENTVRYLGVEIEDALTLAEKTEI